MKTGRGRRPAFSRVLTFNQNVCYNKRSIKVVLITFLIIFRKELSDESRKSRNRIFFFEPEERSFRLEMEGAERRNILFRKRHPGGFWGKSIHGKNFHGFVGKEFLRSGGVCTTPSERVKQVFHERTILFPERKEQTGVLRKTSQRGVS